jgi:hypothetical protein
VSTHSTPERGSSHAIPTDAAPEVAHCGGGGRRARRRDDHRTRPGVAELERTHAQPYADGIIAVLIGAYAPRPLGSTKGGSFNDASTAYGSAD